MAGCVPNFSNAAESLAGRRLPNIELLATNMKTINLSLLDGVSVIYAYPRTSPPDGAAIPGWSEIPGAKGCTPQSCGFRDHFADLREAGAKHVFGISTQTTDYQQEVVSRLHLPFPLISDASLALQRFIGLPVFEAGGMTLLHRVTLIVREGVIEKTFHSITDPAANASDVLDYLAAS